MFILKALFVVALIAVVAGGDLENDDKMNKHHEKFKKCMEDTMKLKDCCDIPTDEEEKDDETCKEHLEGIEEKEGKEKGKAFTCYTECMAIEKELLVGGALDMEKIKEEATKDLKKNGAEDLTALATGSIDYCKEQLDAKKEKWSKFKGLMKNKSGEEGGKKCSMEPGFIGMCTLGKLVRECPESRQVQNDECEALRQSATTMDECMKH